LNKDDAVIVVNKDLIKLYQKPIRLWWHWRSSFFNESATGSHGFSWRSAIQWVLLFLIS